MPIVRSFQVTNGVVAAERTPTDPEDLYASPTELASLFGCTRVTEEDIRYAQGLIQAHCNRPSLWPCVHETPIIQIPSGRQQTRLPLTPVIDLKSIVGRFNYGRRDRQFRYQPYYDYAAILSVVGGAPAWSAIPVELCDIESATGVLHLATSNFLVPYNEVKVEYVGGYIEIPYRIKLALATLINEIHAKGVSDRVQYSAGRITRKYASVSFISPQIEMLLAPFVIQEIA